MSIAQSIEEKLKAAYSPIHFELENESHQHAGPLPRETHFRLVLVSDSFLGVSRVDRQRQVMSLLANEREQGLHALTMRVMTLSEWDGIRDHFKMVSPECRGGSKREKGI